MNQPPIPQQLPLKKSSSGLAITALVFGILGLVPCFTVFCAPVALILGIISWSSAKKTGSPKGLAIAGSILGAVGALGVALLFVLGLWGSELSKPKPFTVAAPSYEGLTGEGFSGSGFHFSSNGKLYIGCSLHQFDGKSPDFMLFVDPEAEDPFQQVPITGQVHTQEDVQVLTYDFDKLDATSALTYKPHSDPTVGDPVYLLIDDTAVKAHVTRLDFFGNTWFEAKEPFKGRGSSGSAVVSGLTGDVVGVILGGEGDGESTTKGYFEPLKMK